MIKKLIIILLTVIQIPCFLYAKEKRSFQYKEYGTLYWEDSTGWQHNWLVKPDIEFNAIEIIIIDQDSKQKILITNEEIDLIPIHFQFYLNAPKPMGSIASPTFAVPYGFSRIGAKVMGTSKWFYMEGKEVVKFEPNKKPVTFDQSNEFTFAHITTKTEDKNYNYRIVLRYDINN